LNKEHDFEPAVCSRELYIDLKHTLQKEQLINRVEKFLCLLTDELAEKGCNLIGHIKGMIDGGNAGSLFFSLTSFNKEPHFKGDMQHVKEIKVTLNVIVYGINENQLEAKVDELEYLLKTDSKC